MRSSRDLSPQLLRRLMTAAEEVDLVILAVRDPDEAAGRAMDVGHRVLLAGEGVIVLASDGEDDANQLPPETSPCELWMWRRSTRTLDRLDPDEGRLLWRSGVGAMPVDPFLPADVLDELAAEPDEPSPPGSPRFLVGAGYLARHREAVLDRFFAESTGT